MEGFFSEWFEFHKCVLAGDCSIFDIPDAICYIDVVIFIIGFGCSLGIKRWINGERILTRKGDPGFTDF